MKLLTHQACRHATRSSLSCIRYEQKRFAQVSNVRFVTSNSKITDKYREKLDRKRQEEGLESIESLKTKYQDRIEQLRKEAAIPGLPSDEPQTPFTAPQTPFTPPPPPTPQNTLPPKQSHAEAKTGVKTLSSFVDVDKMRDLGFKEIEYLWRLRHANDAKSLCAVLKTEMFSRLAQTAKKHPQFILPLPREGHGAEIHFLQWTFPTETTATVLFTHLAEYKLRGEFSTPHTTITYHLDLAEDKDVVLLQGTVMPDRGVSTEEAKFLLLCLQNFYGQQAETSPRRKLLKQFTDGDSSFKVEELLEEAERLP